MKLEQQPLTLKLWDLSADPGTWDGVSQHHGTQKRAWASVGQGQEPRLLYKECILGKLPAQGKMIWKLPMFPIPKPGKHPQSTFFPWGSQ